MLLEKMENTFAYIMDLNQKDAEEIYMESAYLNPTSKSSLTTGQQNLYEGIVSCNLVRK